MSTVCKYQIEIQFLRILSRVIGVVVRLFAAWHQVQF